MMAAVSRWIPISLLSLLAAACQIAAEPYLDPFDPPPTIADGWLLVDLDPGIVAMRADPSVVGLRDRVFRTDPKLTAARRAWIESHAIVTGMTHLDTILAFVRRPSRVRTQGPPGGRTFLWEPDRIWVRFDESEHAVAAGRY